MARCCCFVSNQVLIKAVKSQKRPQSAVHPFENRSPSSSATAKRKTNVILLGGVAREERTPMQLQLRTFETCPTVFVIQTFDIRLRQRDIKHEDHRVELQEAPGLNENRFTRDGNSWGLLLRWPVRCRHRLPIPLSRRSIVPRPPPSPGGRTVSRSSDLSQRTPSRAGRRDRRLRPFGQWLCGQYGQIVKNFNCPRLCGHYRQTVKNFNCPMVVWTLPSDCEEL